MSSLGTNKDQSTEKYMGDQFDYYSIVLKNKGLEIEIVRILKVLAALDFSGNRFEGEIPDSISLLKELYSLIFSNNAFTGHIPSSMGNLTSLESLDVSQNKLSACWSGTWRHSVPNAALLFLRKQLGTLRPCS
ncbi:receptor like protein 32 [Raphanus sativus]|nr:receptor like protein 32 [Raphanus sativus]